MRSRAARRTTFREPIHPHDEDLIVPPCCIVVGVFLSGIWQKSAEEIAALGGDQSPAPAPKRRRFRLLGRR